MSHVTRASRLLLYKRDASPPSCAVRMLGQILNLQFQFHDPDLMKQEHKSPEYIKMNPMGTVPVLVDGDFVVSDSHAIMKYLIRQYGGKHTEALYPNDAKTRAIIDQCMYFDAGVFFVALKNVSLPILLHGATGPTEANMEDSEKAYDMLEMYLQKNSYLASDHLTLADLSVGATALGGQCMFKIDPARHPRCKEWLEMLTDKSYFREIMVPGATLLSKLLHVMAKRNKEALANKS